MEEYADQRAHDVAWMTAKERNALDARPLYIIARDIEASWPKPYFGAVPYIHAMGGVNKITDSYGYDTARDVVIYFLSNAKTWRGEDARRIKAELKGML